MAPIDGFPSRSHRDAITDRRPGGGRLASPAVTPLQGALIGLLGALLGVLGTGGIQYLSDARRAQHDVDRRNWELKRDTYFELLGLLDRIDAKMAGAVHLGSVGFDPGADGLEVRRVSAAAEALAGPTVWEDIRPYVIAVSLRSNALTLRSKGRDTSEVERMLTELDAHTIDGFDDIRSRCLTAVRTELGLA